MILCQFIHPLMDHDTTQVYGPFRYLHMVRDPHHHIPALWTPNHVERIAQEVSGGLWRAPNNRIYEEFIVRASVDAAFDEEVAKHLTDLREIASQIVQGRQNARTDS